MAEYTLQRECAICGAMIGDDNPDGIGGQCREVYRKSSWSVFFEDDARRADYYRLKMAPVVERFIDELKNTKFRSNFWKGFYPSIVEQWNQKHFVSKKQYEIIISRLESNIDYQEIEHLTEQGRCDARVVFDSWEPSEEERQHIINLANKLRH